MLVMLLNWCLENKQPYSVYVDKMDERDHSPQVSASVYYHMMDNLENN